MAGSHAEAAGARLGRLLALKDAGLHRASIADAYTLAFAALGLATTDRSRDTCRAMSQETMTAPVQAVRIPLTPETRRHRTLEERIVVRFPGVFRWLGAAWARLPRHSRLRRALLTRRVRRTYAAVNRRDFDLLLAGVDPRFEFNPVQTGPESAENYQGYDGFREVWRMLLEAFGEIRLDPEEVLDLGDRLLITVKMSGRGMGSGAPWNQQLFSLVTLRRGLVVRQDEFFDRTEALEAAGLSE